MSGGVMSYAAIIMFSFIFPHVVYRQVCTIWYRPPEILLGETKYL